MLKEFVESAIKLQGKWSSLGGNSKKFTCCSIDITITWYAKKQNTLILHGNASLALIDTLIKVCNTLLSSRDASQKYLQLPTYIREKDEIVQLKKDLFNEREKCKQLEGELAILVRGRNQEIND